MNEQAPHREGAAQTAPQPIELNTAGAEFGRRAPELATGSPLARHRTSLLAAVAAVTVLAGLGLFLLLNADSVPGTGSARSGAGENPADEADPASPGAEEVTETGADEQLDNQAETDDAEGTTTTRSADEPATKGTTTKAEQPKTEEPTGNGKTDPASPAAETPTDGGESTTDPETDGGSDTDTGTDPETDTATDPEPVEPVDEDEEKPVDEDEGGSGGGGVGPGVTIGPVYTLPPQTISIPPRNTLPPQITVGPPVTPGPLGP